MFRKSVVPFEVKADVQDGLTDGEFVAYASVFGNVDSYGDIVEPGAFANTLEQWLKSGLRLPLLWGHDFSDPMRNIGYIDLERSGEDTTGLRVHGVITDLADNATARQVYRLIKGRRINQMSFAFDIVKSEDSDSKRLLQELKLYEVSIVPIGANSSTFIESVKSEVTRLEKAGRTLNAVNEERLNAALQKIKDGISDVEAVIASATPPSDGKADSSVTPQERATGESRGKELNAEEPGAAKACAHNPETAAQPSVEELEIVFDMYSFM